MQKSQCRILVILLICAILFPCVSGLVAEEQAEAKSVRTIKYTAKKGKKISISSILNSSSLSKKKKKKARNCIWKIKNKKIVKLYPKKKKIKAIKNGSTYLKGYHSKKKLYIRIRIKVETVKNPSLTRLTSKGFVKGKKNSSKHAMIWYGIPYGASTAGKNRFRAPQDVTPWTGVKQTTSMRKRALQYSSSDSNGYIGTEDCLYVNVYRPYTLETNLPVLVYLHGGGNCSGTANVDFTEIARETNSVIVSVSYRLGAFGFLSHPALQEGTQEEKSGNFALLDVKKALQWVQTDIGAFGGNNQNVTLSGFSGGARMALLCLIAPSMKGLFHKAIILSGGFTTSTPEEGKTSVESKLARVLVDRGIYPDKQTAKSYIASAGNEELKGLFQTLTKAELAKMYKSFDLKMSEFPHGFTDGTVLPKQGFSVISQGGTYNRVPVMLGSDMTEFATFGWNGSAEVGILSSTEPAVLTSNEQYLVGTGIQYGSMLQSHFYIENVASILYDDIKHKSIYAFRNQWGTNAGVTDGFYSRFVGAYHGQSRDFLLGNYKQYKKNYSPDAVSAKNMEGREALTKQMRNYVANFLLTGNPNGNSLMQWNTWNPLVGIDKIMMFNAGKEAVTSAMSTQMYDRDEIFRNLCNVTAESDYDLLTKSLFADRFFMPDLIPSYY